MSLSPAQERTHRTAPAFVPVDGGRIAVRCIGRGRPVLLLHGISADHTEWQAVADGLASDHLVVLPDLLGRGASVPEPDAGFSLRAEVDRLETLLGTLDVERPLVGGHSHGASLALGLAARIPVSGLVLASPVTPWTRRPRVLDLLHRPRVRRAVEPLLRACRRPLTRYILTRRVYGRRPPHLAEAVQRYAAPYADAARARALLRAFRDWRPDELLDVSAPAGVDVRVVTGGADRRIRPADARRWAARLEAPCVVLEGVGHGLTEEAPDRVERLLRDIGENPAGSSGNRELR